MSEHDDELARWADDDLVRALRAPGTAAELADQEQYVEAFREAHGATPKVRSLPRRAAGRLGAGGTAVVVTVALTSGVAAAYTGHLPDPVQQIAHTVIGAPAPDTAHRRTDAGRSQHGQVLAPLPSGSTATTDPSGATSAPSTSAPTDTPTDGPTRDGAQPSAGSSAPGLAGPSLGPSGEPSATSTPTASTGTPGGMSAGGVTHRVGVGETVTLSSTLTSTDGTPLADYPVVLQVRGRRHWLPVTETTTDVTGAASATTPPLTRSARFRWHTDHRTHSTQWVVQMVPTLTVSATVGGTTTEVTATTLGGRPGDRVQLLRWTNHHASGVRRGVLDVTGSVSLPIDTPSHRGVYAVRLLPTRAHTAVRARVHVVPPAVASVGLAVPSQQVPVGGSMTVSGVVRAADGSALPHRRVRLEVRGPKRWFGVGSATTDSAGGVTLATPAARRTARYRLRAGNGVHSDPVRVAMVPTLTATSRADGVGADVVATASGGNPGNRVVLLRRVGGRLVKVAHAPLGADGTVTFAVARHRRSTTYVVRLPATKRHAMATASTSVLGTG